nr:unnamed protein product [Digitaria exilis]
MLQWRWSWRSGHTAEAEGEEDENKRIAKAQVKPGPLAPGEFIFWPSTTEKYFGLERLGKKLMYQSFKKKKLMYLTLLQEEKEWRARRFLTRQRDGERHQPAAEGDAALYIYIYRHQAARRGDKPRVFSGRRHITDDLTDARDPRPPRLG